MAQGGLVIAQLQDAIYTWARTVLDGAVPPGQILWRQQSEALPPRPCLTLKITSGPSRTGFSDGVGHKEGTVFGVGGHRVMMVSVQAFGNAPGVAAQIAKDLNASLSRTTVLDLLRKDGLSVHDQGSPLNISALEETEHEDRSQFDVMFGVAENVNDDQGAIETVTIPPVNLTE